MVYRGYSAAGGGDPPYMPKDFHSAGENSEDYVEGPRPRDDNARDPEAMPYHRAGRRDEDDGPVRDRRPFRSRSGDSRDERPRYPDGPRRGDRPPGGPRPRSNRADDRYPAERPRSSRYRDEDEHDYHRDSSRYTNRKEPRMVRSRSRSQDEPEEYPRYRDRKDAPRYPGDDEGRYPESSRYRSRNSWSGHPGRYNPDDDAVSARSVPEEPAIKNMYQNDGSFLEMFKKMQEAQNPKPEGTSTANPSETDGTSKPDDPSSAIVPKKPVTSLVGKRRGGRVLPTGKVKKLKKDEDEEKPTNAWSIYMAEVRKYKEASCEEEGKTRPLVK